MEIRKRRSCRAILLTPQNEILLIKLADPEGGWVGWITPGGGIDRGESEGEALVRELKEEVGFTPPTEGRAVWTRFHKFPWRGRLIEQHETFYFIPTEKFALSTDTALTDAEKLDFRDVRWWSLEDVARSTEEFAPDDLADRLKDLIANGPPIQPVVIGG